jgi:hypothetical protein
LDAVSHFQEIHVVEARILPLVVLLLVVSCPQLTPAAEAQSGAEFFPDTVVLYAELTDPARLLDIVLDHPLRHNLESLDAIKQAYETPQFLQFKAVVAAIEAQLGQTWVKLIKSATTGGIAVAVDAKTQGVAVVITAKDEQTPKELLKSLTKMVAADASANPFQTKEYRGLTVYQFDQSRVVVIGKTILATNNAKLGQQIVDMYLDKVDNTLAQSKQFKQAQKLAPADATLWGYIDVAAIRQAGLAKELFTAEYSDNPALELLMGGILASIKKTPVASFAASLTGKRLSFEFAVPHDPTWIAEDRDYFFGPKGKGAAPPLLHVDGELLSLSTYRDISQMWLRAGDLFDDNVNDGLAQADANLTTFFSGKDFGEDILGAVTPQMQLVVSRQEFEEDGPQPAIKLPAFALALWLRDLETMRPELRRTYQNLIGFLNVVGAMNGQPQLDLDIDKNGDRQIVTASYLPEKDADTKRLPINYNFSPTVGFLKDRFVVASTKSLANGILDQLEGNPPEPTPTTNTDVQANLAGLSQILDDNRETLVAQNMLSDGHTKDEAEAEINLLLNLLDTARNAALRLTTKEGELRLALELTFAPRATPSP